jgi:queuosine precursor transporter
MAETDKSTTKTESKEVNLTPALLSASFYSVSQVLANILSVKIAYLPIVHLAVDGGTIIYPLTFTLRDFVHKAVGKKNARMVVIASAGISAVSALLLFLIGKMPADPSWGLQGAYENVLMPVGRITVASLIAQLVSELIDTEVFSYFYKKWSDIAGSFISNFIALIADSLIFSFIAFFGALPISTVLAIVISNILIKAIVSFISVPAIRLVRRNVSLEEI